MLVPTLLIPVKLHARQRFALNSWIGCRCASFQFRDFVAPILGRLAGRIYGLGSCAETSGFSLVNQTQGRARK